MFCCKYKIGAKIRMLYSQYGKVALALALELISKSVANLYIQLFAFRIQSI